MSKTDKPKTGYKAGTAPAVLLDAIRAAGAAGQGLDELTALAVARNRQRTCCVANRISDVGLAFKSGKGKKSSTVLRWFSTAEYCQAWEEQVRKSGMAQALAAEPLRAADVVRSAVLGRKREANERRADERAKARSEAEPVYTAETIYSKAPTPLDHRYQVRGKVVGGFFSAGIGHYSEPARGWAAAAVEARGATS